MKNLLALFPGDSIPNDPEKLKKWSKKAYNHAIKNSKRLGQGKKIKIVKVIKV